MLGWNNPVLNHKQVQVIRKYMVGDLVPSLKSGVRRPAALPVPVKTAAEATFRFGLPPDRTSLAGVVGQERPVGGNRSQQDSFVPLALREAFVRERMKLMPAMVEKYRQARRDFKQAQKETKIPY